MESLREIGCINDLSQGRVTACTIVPQENGIITVADDKSLRIWLQREGTNQYWPSVCQYLPTPGTSVYLDPSGEHLAVGTDDGQVFRYEVQPDCNSLILQKQWNAHSCPVLKVTADFTTVFVKKRTNKNNQNVDLSKVLIFTLGKLSKSIIRSNFSRF